MAVVKKFRIQTACEEDYLSYNCINSDKNTTERFSQDFRIEFSSGAGYNPGSHLGNRQECGICGKGGSECIGHPQVLKLGINLLSEFGIKIISRLSSIICRICNKIIHDGNNEIYDLKSLMKLSKDRKKCDCQGHPTIALFKEEKIEVNVQEYEWRAGRRHKKKAKFLDATIAIDTIKTLINNANLKSLGINPEHVRNLFYDRVILPPTSIHPMSFDRGNSGGVGEETGMMKKYRELFIACRNNHTSLIREIIRSLVIGSESKKYGAITSYMTAANGKEGIFRDSAQSKRILETGRGVLTVGTKRACELEVPKGIANNLHYTYIVSVHNIKQLQTKVGQSVTHLVKDMPSPTNQRKFYEMLTPRSRLKIGDRVLKKLENGDMCTFSRHPVLWGHSLISYSVFISDNNCIGLHESNTQGHNADFDGDEGNVHIGTNSASRVELQMFDSKYRIFGSHSGEPVIRITYNGIVGAYVISNDTERMSNEIYQTLKSIIEGKGESQYFSQGILIDEEYYKEASRELKIPFPCGKIVFSMLLPKSLNYKRGDVEIKKGILIKGFLKTEDVSNKLIVAISNIETWKAPYLFIDRGYVMLSEYISKKGISLSPLDYIMPGEYRKQILPEDFQSKLKNIETKVHEMEISKKHQTRASAERTEEEIVLLISGLQNEIEKIFKTGEYRKRSISIVSYLSGARGNIGSITSGTSMVGQMFTGSGRLGDAVLRLSYYSSSNSTSMKDKGFIANSYADGLTPREVFTLASPAREAAFKTYLGTPKSGHASRQNITALSSFRLSPSLSIITQSGKILDALYGYGCDSSMFSLREFKIEGRNDKTEMVVDALQLLEMINQEI